jgi:antitoxin HicB
MLHKEPEYGFTAFVPSLPGCLPYGGNIDEAMVMAKDAVELYLEELIERGEEITDDKNMLEYSLNLVTA